MTLPVLFPGGVKLELLPLLFSISSGGGGGGDAVESKLSPKLKKFSGGGGNSGGLLEFALGGEARIDSSSLLS